jgi:hypothetical protein
MLAEKLSALSLEELRTEVRHFVKIPASVAKRKRDLLDFIENSGNVSMSTSLETLATEKAMQKENKHRFNAMKRKRDFVEDRRERNVIQRVEEQDDGSNDVERYLELPTDEEVALCYRQFFEATGSEAVVTVVCGVCAREVNVKEDKVVVRSLTDVPNAHRLVPINKHPAHELFNDMLLEPRGINGTEVNICGECTKDLQKNITTPPRFSLANNLWVGKVPEELEGLTLPEQLLIAHLYPRVYVFKLYPKSFDRCSDGSTLQRGMRGNVSTYKLDMEGITSMIKGSLMPRPPAILASIISVTFIGAGTLPSRAISSIFRVRRHVVLRALQWLKKNNKKYYGDINIDTDQLSKLPEDDVPPEILAIIHQSSDVGIVDEESAGYVPKDDDCMETSEQDNKTGNAHLFQTSLVQLRKLYYFYRMRTRCDPFADIWRGR